MSMNVGIYGRRKIFTEKGKEDWQYSYFEVPQIPTNSSYKIVESEDQIQSYKDFICEWWGEDEEEDVDPLWWDYIMNGDNEKYKQSELPDGFGALEEDIPVIFYNRAEKHIEKFEKWLKNMEENEYEVFFKIE